MEEALAAGVDRIMLDNMDRARLRESLERIGGKVQTEISGNVTLESLSHLVPLRATYISVGALTHSVAAVDFSMTITME